MEERLSDEALIDELKRRFKENEQAFHDLRVLTKKLEHVNRKLQESESMKGNFLSNIRNEINNPLTSIMGLSKQLQSGRLDAESIKDIGKMIYVESFDLDFQLENIFIAAELEAGESQIGVSRIDVSSFVQNIIDLLSHSSEVKNINIRFTCEGVDDSGNRLLFNTDSEKLHVAIVNIITNAIEFSDDGSDVNVEARISDGLLQISVEDFGRGISKEDQMKIFDRFKQLDTGTQKTHRGHGLGLTVSKSLVELMGGRLRLQSEVGKGSVFTIEIPPLEGVEGMDVFSEEGNEFIFEEGDVKEL